MQLNAGYEYSAIYGWYVTNVITFLEKMINAICHLSNDFKDRIF